MATRRPATEQQGRIADRLAAARRGRFVGRAGELARFRAALLAPEPPFVALHLHGPGGVGKTTLLREFARIAAECGRPVARIDGRDIEPSPDAFLRAYRQAAGLPGGTGMASAPADGVLLIDTYELVSALDGWLRDTFIPQLPARSVVVIAGREAPVPAWRTDLDWSALAAIVPLGNLLPEEGAAYLATRGISAERHAAALAFTRGHPLALTLIADLLGRGDDLASFDPQAAPEVIRLLLERLVREVPSQRHRRALEVCALARVTTERLLADALPGDAPPGETAHDLFAWLRGRSFVEHSTHGIFPHDLVRDLLATEARWRDPEAHQRLGGRIYLHLRRRIGEVGDLERQRLQLEALYATRHRPFMRTFFAWDEVEAVYATSATTADAEGIVAMVRAHEGEASAALARHWLARQPEAFQIFRSRDDAAFGFMAHLALDRATPEDLAADPGAVAALTFARRYGVVAPGERILQLRFWMHRQHYQAVTAAINLTAMNLVTQVLAQPGIAWNFITMADPDFWLPHFAGLNWPRSPEADFTVAGRRYGTFAHDWRVEPPERWMGPTPPRMPFDHAGRGSVPPPTPPLARADHDRAVRQALRDYTRPDRLADNPLLRSGLLGGAAGRDAVAALQALLREAVEGLRANPRDAKFHRALWHTYVAPAPTQEAAAELLHLPFNTYRYHLAAGIDRVADWLWRREHHAAR